MSRHDTTRFRPAMRKVLAKRLASFISAEADARRRDAAEGVHDMRVASRRLRAATEISQGLFPASWRKPLHRAVKRIADALGEVRDRDVQLETLTELRAEASSDERAGIDRLVRRIERERDEAAARLASTLDDPATREALDTAARRLGVAGERES